MRYTAVQGADPEGKTSSVYGSLEVQGPDVIAEAGGLRQWGKKRLYAVLAVAGLLALGVGLAVVVTPRSRDRSPSSALRGPFGDIMADTSSSSDSPDSWEVDVPPEAADVKRAKKKEAKGKEAKGSKGAKEEVEKGHGKKGGKASPKSKSKSEEEEAPKGKSKGKGKETKRKPEPEPEPEEPLRKPQPTRHVPPAPEPKPEPEPEPEPEPDTEPEPEPDSSSDENDDETDEPAATGDEEGPASTVEHCRDCTAAECKTAQCNPDLTPYACLTGAAHGGCAATEKPWLNPSCTDCCSLKVCKDLAPGCGQCTPAECDLMKVPCGANRVYACLAGRAHGGCSNRTEDWGPAAYFDGTCTRCCDLTTCGFQTNCGTCTPAQCSKYAIGCGALLPFVCTGGKSAGGCAKASTFWKDAIFTGACTGCCDTSKC